MRGDVGCGDRVADVFELVEACQVQDEKVPVMAAMREETAVIFFDCKCSVFNGFKDEWIWKMRV